MFQFRKYHCVWVVLSRSRHDYRGASSKVNARLYKDVYEFWLKQATATHEATGVNQTLVIQHVSKNVAQQGINRGGNTLGQPLTDYRCWPLLFPLTQTESGTL